MTYSNKIKNIIDKIANLQEIGNETSLFEYAEYTNNKSMAIAMCFRLISQLFINLFIVLPILKPGNKISEAVNSVMSNCNDDSVNMLLNNIYNEAIREPEGFNDFVYQQKIMVIGNQIKKLSDYITANTFNDCIREVGIVYPTIRKTLSILKQGIDENNNND